MDAQEALKKGKSDPKVYLEEVAETFRKLRHEGIAARNNPLLGNRSPAPAPAAAGSLSAMSGPRADLPAELLRRDELGQPKMPAQNAEYLGRSLFSDYLLAVELAGMLLLVATIGAIAIAQRHHASRPRERTS